MSKIRETKGNKKRKKEIITIIDLILALVFVIKLPKFLHTWLHE